MAIRDRVHEIRLLAAVLILVSLPPVVQPQILYWAENELHSSPAPQLWYNGYWKHVRPLNQIFEMVLYHIPYTVNYPFSVLPLQVVLPDVALTSDTLPLLQNAPIAGMGEWNACRREGKPLPEQHCRSDQQIGTL